MKLKLNDDLKGSLGEFYFKHYCMQHNYLYAKTEDIAKEFTPLKRVVTFIKGFERIPILIPDDICPEIFQASKPSNYNSQSPSYTIDFLTCTDWKKDRGTNPKDFVWVEIKTGSGKLSHNQQKFKENCKLRFCVFRILDVLCKPEDIDVVWEEDIPSKM